MLLVLLLSSILIRVYSAPISDIDTTIIELLTACTCPDPTTSRTTWSIVWSCLTTLFLCTWVSVHPNIPPHNDTRTAISVRRLKIMLWALVVPELVIFWAMRQWFGARKVVEMFKAHDWTRMQAHFAQMGGFILYENNEPVRALSPEELLLWSQDSKIDFPNISEREIEDRSKNDALSKVLVIFQTSWFFIQFTVRGAEGKVITEIEVVTLTLAMLNGVMYFLWWNKPFDVQCGIPVHLKALEPPTTREDLGVIGGNVTDQVVEELGNNINGTDGCQEQNSSCTEMDNMTNQEHGIFFSEHHSAAFDANDRIKGRACTNWSSWKTKLFKVVHALIILLSPVTTTIVCVSDGLHSLLFFLFITCIEVPVNQIFDSPKALNPSVTPFYAVQTCGKHYSMIELLASGIGMLTGAIHCIIWTFPFPSHAEEVLWRTATVQVIAYPLFMFIRRALFVVASEFMSVDVVIKGKFNRVSTFIGFFALVGRLSLLVQAIISLRDIPAAAFESDNWSYMIPHL